MVTENPFLDLKIDFLNNPAKYQRKKHRGKNELIAKALGINKGIKKILDLTCGLAEDAVFLTQLGCQVLAFEKNKLLYEALSKALIQAHQNSQLTQLEIKNADSILFLKSKEFQLVNKQEWSIYLDPMFPKSKKSALPRKEMQVFRSLMDTDENDELIFEAIHSGVSRVVLKRPLKSPKLFNPVHSFLGSTVRYDLYMTKV